MSVGTPPFGLQDVTFEIYGDTNADRNLIYCFEDAHPDGFNVLWEGDKDRLLNFAGYEHVAHSISANPGFVHLSGALDTQTIEIDSTYDWTSVSIEQSPIIWLEWSPTSGSRGPQTNVAFSWLINPDFGTYYTATIRFKTSEVYVDVVASGDDGQT